MVKISVVTPVYNRAHLLLYSIQSVFDQTFQDWELIAVDDGSTDNSFKILQDCAEREPRMKVTRLPRHLGITNALNMGNRLASGEVLVKHDSDDLSLPNRLQVIWDDYEKNRWEFFYHAMYQTFEDESNIGMMRRIFLPALPIEKSKILREQYIPGCFAYTKEFISQVPYRKLICSEDWMLILEAYLKHYKIGWKNEALYEYVQRDDSNSIVNENTGAYEQDEKVMQEILLKEYGIDNFTYAQRT